MKARTVKKDTVKAHSQEEPVAAATNGEGDDSGDFSLLRSTIERILQEPNSSATLGLKVVVSLNAEEWAELLEQASANHGGNLDALISNLVGNAITAS